MAAKKSTYNRLLGFIVYDAVTVTIMPRNIKFSDHWLMASVTHRNVGRVANCCRKIAADCGDFVYLINVYPILWHFHSVGHHCR